MSKKKPKKLKLAPYTMYLNGMPMFHGTREVAVNLTITYEARGCHCSIYNNRTKYTEYKSPHINTKNYDTSIVIYGKPGIHKSHMNYTV